MRYIGIGTSTFQSDPRPDIRILSDWEQWVARQEDIDPASLPHMLKRFPAYIGLLKKLGVNMFRFSLEPRLMPEHGVFDEGQMSEYVKMAALLRISGIEPFVVLNHYTMPLWLTALDGYGNITESAWEHPDVLAYWKTYVDNIVGFLTDNDKMHDALDEAGADPEQCDQWLANGLINHFMTINEPLAVASHGYVTGIFPPHKKSRFDTALRILKKLVTAHDIAYDALHAAAERKGWKMHVGVGYNWAYSEGVENAPARFGDWLVTHAFERNGTHSDFLGEQYYCRLKRRLPWAKNQEDGSGDYLGWGDVYPKGIRYVLNKMHDAYPEKPIFVTEFGFSDKDDLRRPRWIADTMRNIRAAERDGVPVEGVLLWTLAHNLEWTSGMKERFGLCAESDLSDPPTGTHPDARSWEVWREEVKRITAHPK